MPMKPKKPCAHPGCPNLTSSKYCVKHRSLEPAHFESATRLSFYNTKEWREKRAEFLSEHPCCVVCGRSAKIVDHITPIRMGGAPLDDKNLQSLCWSCHSRKSIKEGSRYKRKTYTY